MTPNPFIEKVGYTTVLNKETKKLFWQKFTDKLKNHLTEYFGKKKLYKYLVVLKKVTFP